MEDYNCNHSKEEIKDYLDKIHSLIENDKFIISLGENREKNQSFIEEFNLSSIKQKNILLNVKVEDFCYTTKNKKHGYENEILYIFGPKVALHDITDEEKNITLYLKFNLLSNTVVTISFHEAERTLTYLFS